MFYFFSLVPCSDEEIMARSVFEKTFVRWMLIVGCLSFSILPKTVTARIHSASIIVSTWAWVLFFWIPANDTKMSWDAVVSYVHRSGCRSMGVEVNVQAKCLESNSIGLGIEVKVLAWVASSGR